MIGKIHQMHPTAFARKDNLIFKGFIDAKELKENIKIFLSELVEALKCSGCKLIGHIKGLIDVRGKGYITFSITSFKEDAYLKGRMSGGIEKAVLRVNIIVYGIDQEIIEALYQRIFNKHFG